VYAATLLGNADEIILSNALTGFEEVATHRDFLYYLHPESLAVQDILKYFDIPELALVSGAKWGTWINPLDRNEAPLGEKDIVTFAAGIERLKSRLKTKAEIRIVRNKKSTQQ
jgi:hypothetical protein